MSSILIVGAGAIGVATGYHLGLGGTEVTFLVRPESRARAEPPLTLYCYDDTTLKHFSGYRLITSPREAAGHSHDFILLTLDGAACRSDSGSRLIRELAEATRNSNARLIIGGVGSGLYEHIRTLTGFPDARLMQGSLGSLCHQVPNADLPVHAPTDVALLAQAAFAYRHFPNRVGFSLAAAPRAAAREFKALYDRCSISRCQLSPLWAYTIFGNAFFPYFASCDIAGWPSVDTLVADKALWSLNCAAHNEIIRLHAPAWARPLVGLLLNEKRYAALFRKLEQDSLPLDFHAFNRFHHGGKVLAQDIQIMRNCVTLGESRGQPMEALRALLARLQDHYRTKGEAARAALVGPS